MTREEITSISIIVPCHNAAKTLDACLASITEAIAYTKANTQIESIQLIVIDDASIDESRDIASGFDLELLSNDTQLGANATRNIGFQNSTGEILISIDADVVIRELHFCSVLEAFSQDPKLDCLTAMLDSEPKAEGFFSDYKNLYMDYTFSRQPRFVTFLYGSFFAIKSKVAKGFALEKKPLTGKHAEDTELGQKLSAVGRKILLAKNIKVTHLKEYSFFSLLKNDYITPYRWSQIFLANNAWREAFSSSRFAHASIWQVLALLFSTLALLSLAFKTKITFLFILAWIILNSLFFRFLIERRGIYFALRAALFTLIDQFTMFIGMLCGFLNGILEEVEVLRRDEVKK